MIVTVQSATDYRLRWKHNRFQSVSYSDSFPVASVGSLSPDSTRAALLLSRLPKRVQSGEPWLCSVRDAVDIVHERGWCVVSSCDLLGWDYVSWYAGRVGVNLLLILPAESVSHMENSVRRLRIQLDLDIERTMFVMPVPVRKLKKQERYLLRDKMMFNHASAHIPVAVRPDGRWDTMLAESGNRIEQFQVKYPRPKPPEWRKVLSRMSVKTRAEWDDMLFHWTRGQYAPWIGETIADYFEALTANVGGNPRDGFATLEHIIRSGVLRGRARMIRGQKPMISFTTVIPALLNDYVQFRSTLARWTFEPYGIAIPTKLLRNHGIRPVIYGDDDLYESLPDSDRSYFQVAKGGSSDWSGEREWRLFGDLDLKSIKEHVKLITLREDEAIHLRRTTDFDSISIENMG